MLFNISSQDCMVLLATVPSGLFVILSEPKIIVLFLEKANLFKLISYFYVFYVSILLHIRLINHMFLYACHLHSCLYSFIRLLFMLLQ